MWLWSKKKNTFRKMLLQWKSSRLRVLDILTSWLEKWFCHFMPERNLNSILENWHGSVRFGKAYPHQNQILAPWEINDGHSAQNYCLLVYSALHLQQPHSASPFFCSDCGLRLFLSYARTILTLWQRWNFFGVNSTLHWIFCFI